MSPSADENMSAAKAVYVDGPWSEPLVSLEGASATVAPLQQPADTDASGDEKFPLADPGEYYTGLWSGLPNYGCPYCGFATLEGSGTVELHILEKIDRGSARHMKALDKK